MSIKSILQTMFLDKEAKKQVNFLKKLYLFEGLSDRAMFKIMGIMYAKEYPANEIIFSEKDIGRAVFIIKSGEVEITKSSKDTNKNIVLSKLSAGDFFGEMALLEEEPRSATARTTKNSELLFMYKVRFDALLEHYPRGAAKVVHNLAKMLSKRLRHTSEIYAKND